MRHRILVALLGVVLVFGCGKQGASPERGHHRDSVEDTPAERGTETSTFGLAAPETANPEPETKAEDRPQAEPVVVRETGPLLRDVHVALFSDQERLIAFDAEGTPTMVLNEPFGRIAIDFESDILWLNRPWSTDHEKGLFIASLDQQPLKPIKVTHLMGGVEFVDVEGHPVPMTAGAGPYRISLRADRGVTIESSSDLTVCGEECTPSAEAVEFSKAALGRGVVANRERAVITTFSLPDELEKLAPDYSVQLPDTNIRLHVKALFGDGMAYGWQVFDLVHEEYICPTNLRRSSTRWPSGCVVHHLMVCEGSGHVIIERGLFDRNLTRLDDGGLRTLGVCLRGGKLLEDRT